MRPFVTPLDVANEVMRRRPDLPAGAVYSSAEWHAAKAALVRKERKATVGRSVFVRRKGHKVPGRLHTFHGKIIDLDGHTINVEFHSEIGKHIERFYAHEAYFYICEQGEQYAPAAIRQKLL